MLTHSYIFPLLMKRFSIGRCFFFGCDLKGFLVVVVRCSIRFHGFWRMLVFKAISPFEDVEVTKR